ncbi:hypothetical protein [Thermoleophilum album]|uniref:hypothetical protein n=1 Tax=Thermoleophilum album TaxID=29539 RepID=UPI000B8401DC|nr:hypothetical protein [Thermoleophilum album]
MSDHGERASQSADGSLPVEAPVVVGEALPAVADVRPIDVERAGLPAPVAVAAAAGGFLLGVAAFVLVRSLRVPWRVFGLVTRRRARRRQRRVEIAASRSFLVDIHFLRER